MKKRGRLVIRLLERFTSLKHHRLYPSKVTAIYQISGSIRNVENLKSYYEAICGQLNALPIRSETQASASAGSKILSICDEREFTDSLVSLDSKRLLPI